MSVVAVNGNVLVIAEEIDVEQMNITPQVPQVDMVTSPMSDEDGKLTYLFFILLAL